MERDEWRAKVSPESGLDSILLDALVFDSDSVGIRRLILSKVEISRTATNVYFAYGDKTFKIVLTEGVSSGEESYERVKLAIDVGSARQVAMALSFSSHAYIKDILADGVYDLNCSVLPARIVNLSDGYGVDALVTHGSAGVDGHDANVNADGDVVLEDGYCTSPIIHRGRVVVRVGKRYGLDSCHYDYGAQGAKDCRKPLFFFCGQNAVNSGNIMLKGGKGVSVQQGRSYAVKSGSCAGRTVPCIEIVAGRELMDIYRPRAWNKV
jgi:hypothetical protein